VKRSPLLLVPSVACTIAFFSCSDSSPGVVLGPSPEAGAVDARSQLPPPSSGDDDDVIGGDDDDDDDDVDAGKHDADTPKDAGKDAAPPAPKRKRVFVTKAKFSGDLKTAGAGTDGADGADKLCLKAATDANLGGAWVAWVSVTGKNAIDRVLVDTPWYLVDRTTLVFDGKSKLTSKPEHAIDMNETGTTTITGTGPLTNRTWTGTNSLGVGVAGKDCAEWTDGTAAASAVSGTYRGETSDWTRYALDANETCNKTWSLYCFEQ